MCSHFGSLIIPSQPTANTMSAMLCGADAHLCFVSSQGRHVKTGQLAAIKVMDVTEVRPSDMLFQLDIAM